MKLSLKHKTCLALALTVVAGSAKAAPYLLTITNGGVMPLSPAVVYVRDGQAGLATVGTEPTPGFIQLCQTGNGSLRTQELMANPSVKSVATTAMGVIMPGESRTVELEVSSPLTQSVHFESMYGKTKDACALGAAGSHALYALEQHVSPEYLAKDDAVVTGAFQGPALPPGRTYLDMNVCSMSADAVACVRELSQPTMGKAQIRVATPYLSTVQMLLETKYGAGQAQTLVVPSAGAVAFSLKLRH